MPAQIESKRRKSRKFPTVPPARDAKGKFVPPMTTSLAPPTEVFLIEMTRTPGTTSSSEQLRPMVTEPVVDAVAPTEVVLEVDSPYLTGLNFPMPMPDELASFIYSTFIIPKLSENKSFFVVVSNPFKNTIMHISFHFSNLTSELNAFHSRNLTP